MNFLIGCAVWAYKGWVGELFPPASRPKEFLQLYSRRLTTVEGNTTFYAIPDKETVARWKAETPKGFEFCLKLPRDLTHSGLLQSSIAESLQFLEQMQELGNRLGPIFAQLPPSYSPQLLDDLTGFLEAWPRKEAPLALEVRHPDWFKQPHAGNLNAILQELGVGRVLLDTRPIYSSPEDAQLHLGRPKPQLPVQPAVTASFSLIRFISHPKPQINEEFLNEWVPLVHEWLRQGIRVYFFVHCPVDEEAPKTARYFQQLLEQHGAPVPVLPWNTLETPTQLSLF